MKKNKVLIGKALVGLAGILFIIIVLRYLPQIIKITLSIQEFRDFILSSGYWGPIVFIGFQILQTVIAPIPGEVVQIAGGYIYGIAKGTIFVTVGMMIGTIISFYFTRFLGRSFVEKLLNKQKFKWVAGLIHNSKLSIILFIFCIIPGLPKDIFVYFVALTPMKPIKFFMIFLIGRLPAILASVSVGSTVYQQNYVATIIISVLSILAFILGLVYKDKIINGFANVKKE